MILRHINNYLTKIGLRDSETVEALSRRLRSSSIVDEKNRLVYVATPKAACTTIKRILLHLSSLELPYAHSNNESSMIMSVHDRTINPMETLGTVDKELLEAVMVSTDYCRFSIVRNPYSRLVSVWSDKVRLHEPDFYLLWNEINQFHSKQSGNDDVNCPTFEEFVMWVVGTQDLSTCNVHWRSMFSLLRPDLIDYTYVLNTETLVQGFQTVLKHAAISQDSGQLLNDFKANESLPINWKKLYSSGLADVVYKAYQKDFETFGYDKDSWKSDEDTELTIEQENIQLRSQIEKLSSAALQSIRDRNEVIYNLREAD